MLERKERSGGEAAAGGGGAGPRAGAAARGLPAVRSTLQQCGLLQDLIDISLSNLRGLRTKCAASNDLTQQEIRTLEVRGSVAAAGPEGTLRQRPPGCPFLTAGGGGLPPPPPPFPSAPGAARPHRCLGREALPPFSPAWRGMYAEGKDTPPPPAPLQPCQ